MKRLGLRISEALHARCVQQAEEERRSLNSMLELLIERGLTVRSVHAEPIPDDRPAKPDPKPSRRR